LRRPLLVQVSALHDGAAFLTATASADFVEGCTLHLAIYLAGECVGVQCPAEQSCGPSGACEPIRRRTLPELDAGDAGPTDALVADVPGVDAPPAPPPVATRVVGGINNHTCVRMS